jgi:hypothetical protein
MVRGSGAEEIAENRAGAAQGGGRRTLRSRDAPNRFSAGVESDGGPRGLRGMRFDQADDGIAPLKQNDPGRCRPGRLRCGDVPRIQEVISTAGLKFRR